MNHNKNIYFVVPEFVWGAFNILGGMVIHLSVKETAVDRSVMFMVYLVTVVVWF
jgi:hypothetical protein